MFDGDPSGGDESEIHFVIPYPLPAGQMVMAAFIGGGILIAFETIEVMPAGTRCVGKLRSNKLHYVIGGVTKIIDMETSGAPSNDV